MSVNLNSIMMPLQPCAHQSLTATGRTTNALEGMCAAHTKLIGAVEDEWELFSDCPEDYTIGEPIGFGASSIVYSAVYRPANNSKDGASDTSCSIPCALKVLDLDSLPPRSLSLLQRETTLMSLSKHPNVLRVRGSWIAGHNLYIALRLMNRGSAADVMRYGWPGGMEEDVVRCILRQSLKGLNYLHINGFIHRDIKAANLLIDDDGTVLLGDLGVAADLAEDTSHVPHFNSTPGFHSTPRVDSEVFTNSIAGVPVPIRPKIGKRKSFVGTPCWMAPELIQGRQYDAKADIWSFGITALELTLGRPPRSRESPQRVLLRIIQEDPPTLDRNGGAHTYSRAFKEIVEWCLNKDPAKRPTAEELLQAPFFKSVKKKSYLINAILKDLPPLARRQERRPLPLVTSATSVDSWDFATTVHSSQTICRPRFLSELEDPIFVMEEDKSVAGTKKSDFKLDGIPSSPTTPASSLRSFGIDGSPSFIPSSTPSSYTDTSEMTKSMTSMMSEAKNTGESLASIAEDTNQLVAIAPQPLTMPLNPDRRRNLWQRLKSNVGRTSSSNNLLESQSHDLLPSKGRKSGMFSASKGLLTGNHNPQNSSLAED